MKWKLRRHPLNKAEALYSFGRYEVHVLGKEDEMFGSWDEEQRGFLQYGVYNTVIEVYEAYSPVEGAAVMMCVEYQQLLDAARNYLKEESKDKGEVKELGAVH